MNQKEIDAILTARNTILVCRAFLESIRCDHLLAEGSTAFKQSDNPADEIGIHQCSICEKFEVKV